VNTKLLHAGSSATEDSLARGAQTSVYLATSLTVEKLTGRYFDNLRETPSAPTTYNKQLRQELWRVSTKMVALKNPA
jgi:hypothetical protein